MDIPFFNTQADLLYFIASLRNARLDPIFLFLNYFDSEYFLMVLIPFVWIGISDLWGLRVAVLLLFSTLINFHLKYLFDLPRPIVSFPDLPMLPFDDPGFPSGGAQTATLLAGLLIYGWKNPWSWIIGLLYVAIICFSRLYLGVHYPMDVIGGIAIGIAILFIYIDSIRYIDRVGSKEGRSFCVILCVLFCFLYAFFVPSPKGYQLMGALLGFGVGAYASSLFRLYPTRSRSIWNRIVSGIVSTLILYILYFLMPSYTPSLIKSFILAIWISCGAAPFCKAVVPKLGNSS